MLITSMKKLLSITLTGVTALFLSACAAVTNSQAGKNTIAKLPEPLKSQFQAISRQQEELGKQYTAGTRKMLEAYALIADSVGLKVQAAKLRAESQALNSGSSLEDSRKAFSKSSSIIKEVQSKISKSNGVTVASKETFTAGVRAKNEAYITEATLAANASIVAAKGIQAIKSASMMEKAVLTTSLDPLFYFSKDIPRFLAQEREFDTACQKYALDYQIKLPKVSLPTPKINVAF